MMAPASPRCQLCGSLVDRPTWEEGASCGCGGTRLTKEQLADFRADRALFLHLVTGDPEARSQYCAAYDEWVALVDSAGNASAAREAELL